MMKKTLTMTSNSRTNTMISKIMDRTTSRTTVKCTKIKIKMAMVKMLKEATSTNNSRKVCRVKAPRMEKNMMRKKSMRWTPMRLSRKVNLN
jgi:hypothetical protein